MPRLFFPHSAATMTRPVKEVAHPSSNTIHHLEVGEIDEVDEEVAAWLTEAAERAG